MSSLSSQTGIGQAHRQGRVLTPGRYNKLTPGLPNAVLMIDAGWSPKGILVFCSLMLALPMFGQSFHYMIDAPPLYALSKSWPMLSVPLVMFSLTQVRLPYTPLCVAMMVYLVGVTPALSIVQLGNRFDDAWMTTVKVWPFLYYFSASAVFIILRPTVRQVSRVLLALGALTFIMMLVLWLVVPTHAYKSDPALSKLFLHDLERGYRIYVPMFFGILFLFYLVRLYLEKPQLWIPPAIITCLVLMLVIYKQRTEMAGILLIMGLAVLTSARGWWRTLTWTLSAVLGSVALIILVAEMMERADDVLGASLSIRQHSITLALAYLEASPWRWLFGVGATTRFGDVRIQDILGGDDSFYLADIGWVGVIFEYGVIGALLILAVYIAGWRTAVGKVDARSTDGTAAQPAGRLSPLQKALGDFFLYAIITSLIHSVVFKPGEIMTVMALAAWLRIHSVPSAARPTGAAPSTDRAAGTRGRIIVPDRKIRTR